MAFAPGWRRFPFIVLVVFLVLAIGFAPRYDISLNLGHILRRASTKLERLRKTLDSAKDANGTVVILALNKAYASQGSMLELFLESFQKGKGTRYLTKHLVIINLDPDAYSTCLQLHNHCYMLDVNKAGLDFAGEKLYMSKDYIEIMWKRNRLLQFVLELGYNFLFTDGDVLWFRDPFKHLMEGYDVQISCDWFNGDEHDVNNEMNTGFLYVRSSKRTLALYKMWNAVPDRHPRIKDQDALNIIKHSPEFAKLGPRFRVLSTRLFSGFCQKSDDLEQVVTVHANCCTSLERKLHDLRLILGDWDRFLSGNNTGWSGPKECRM